jgi:LEA14-like dessication related protein
MDLNLNVKNPNSIPINIDSVSYVLNFSGEKVTDGTLDKAIRLSAGGESQVSVPLKFKFNSIGNLLSGLFNNSKSRQYELTGFVKLGLFSIPFEKKGEVSLSK